MNVNELDQKISRLREAAEDLQQSGTGIQCIERNVIRLLACVKMMELGISDVADITGDAIPNIA